MALRRRSYLVEAMKEGPVRQTGIPGLSYRIKADGSKKHLSIIHGKSGLEVARTQDPIKVPSKTLKEIVAMLKAEFGDMDWTPGKSKLDMRRAVEAANEMHDLLRKHGAWLTKYSQAMKQKGFA